MNDVAQQDCAIVSDMTPEQEQAVAAQDASTRRRSRTKQAQDEANAQSIADALASLRLGVPPAVVEKHSPFSGSYIRRLAREAGIEGDRRYNRFPRQ
jgi:hypothetical protein